MGNSVQIAVGGQTYGLNFDPAQNFSPQSFQLAPNSNGGADLFLAQVAVVSSGQVISNVVASDWVQDVIGSAISATVGGGAYQNIFSGGIASATTVESGGLQTVYPGATDLNATISGGAYEYVLSGGLATDAGVGSQGTQFVFAGGLTISTTLAGEQDIYGLASGTVLASGGLQNVEAGGSAVDTAIASRGEQDVDGIASGTVIASDGLQVVEADGIAFATIVSSGGKQGVFGYASGATVFAGSEVVEAGGSAIDFTILSGGVLVVSSGGYADPGTLSGGTEVISAGGSDDRTQISGGTQFVYGTATNAAVFVGSQVVESGGFASGTVVSGVCWSSSPAVLQSMQLSTAAVQLSSLGAVPLTLSRFPAPPSK